MPEPHIATHPLRRERWLVLAMACLVVVGRSAVFVFRPESSFDADQAIVGLMAKHLSELRAFPVFLYGQTYMLSAQGLKHLSSASGPGTSVADTLNNLVELAGRICISPGSAVSGVQRLFSIHWPATLGTEPMPLARCAIESYVWQGLPWSSCLPAVFVLLSIAGIALAVRSRPRAAPRFRFAQYLVLAGMFSAAGYVFGRCGEVTLLSMRYDLLSVLGIVGLGGWFLAAAPPAALRAVWTLVLAAWMAIAAVPHVRLAAEYATNPPEPPKRELIRVLDAEGIRYGTADYWLAYYIDFITNERIVIASTSPQRILMYNAIVAEHKAEAVRLLRKPCEGGRHLTSGVYRCP